MYKFNLIVLLCVTFICSYAQNLSSNRMRGNDILSSFSHLSTQQLYDTAGWYYSRNSADTALACYGLLINTPVDEHDTNTQRTVVDALYKSAFLYYIMSDYRNAYASLIDGLALCEQYHFSSEEWKIYANLGVIYLLFNKLDMAEQYYSKALNICKKVEKEEDGKYAGILNNLGVIYLNSGEPDTAFYYINKSLQIFKEQNDRNLCSILKSMAIFYQRTGVHDSAYHYYKQSLNEARKNSAVDEEADNLTGLGTLFFNAGQADSAMFYTNLSNVIAKENKFLDIQAENYLTLSKIEETKGRNKAALEHFKTYAEMRDSIFNTKIFGDINQIQHQHEVTKTNRLIEQHVMDKQIRERAIRYQKIIIFIILSILLLMGGMLLVVILQRRKLNNSYKALVEKNLKIIEIQETAFEQKSVKYPKIIPADNAEQKLLDKILTVMEAPAVICDSDFTLDKLTVLAQSNHTYVSHIFNTVLNKNFRSFLNSYRIREAQRLLSELDTIKFTIESVAYQVGFKSPSAFRTTFKEITGVSPSFYLKSIREKVSKQKNDKSE
jgi:AraC-like DNA-binding protein/Flp pilus assembly protein TadD